MATVKFIPVCFQTPYFAIRDIKTRFRNMKNSTSEKDKRKYRVDGDTDTGTKKRNNRGSASHFGLPQTADDIVVLWNVDGDLVWWPAQVLAVKPAVFSGSNGSDVVGNGALRYAARLKHGMVDCCVVFLYDEDHGAQLRSEEDEDEELDAQEPCLWKYPEVTSDVPGGDSKWMPPDELRSSLKKSDPKEKRRRKDSNSHAVISSGMNNATDSEVQLHSAYEMLSKRVTALEQNLSRNEQETGSSKPHVQYMKISLRTKLLRKIQSTFKPKKVLNSGLEGILTDMIRVSCDCNMSWFSEICSDLTLMSTENMTDKMTFIPSILSVIHPSRAAEELRVEFKMLSSVCRWLELRDDQDIESLLSRQAEDKKRRYLRLLGVHWERVASISTSPTVEVDRIAVGHCFEHFVEADGVEKEDGRQALTETIDAKASEEAVTFLNLDFKDTNGSADISRIFLERERRNWDEAMGRYQAPWRLRSVFIPQGKSTSPVSSRTSIQPSTERRIGSSDKQSFSIVWRKAPPPSGRAWTVDATQTGVMIPGSIEINLPCVICFGNITATQVHRLLQNL